MQYVYNVIYYQFLFVDVKILIYVQLVHDEMYVVHLVYVHLVYVYVSGVCGMWCMGVCGMCSSGVCGSSGSNGNESSSFGGGKINITEGSIVNIVLLRFFFVLLIVTDFGAGDTCCTKDCLRFLSNGLLNILGAIVGIGSSSSNTTFSMGNRIL